MYLFVGLGNPGVEYAKHRHNIGFMAVDTIAATYGFSEYREKYKGLLSEGRLGSEKVLLLKPQTYMNLSGESIQATASFYKIDPADIFIFHDELDLQPTQIKIKKGGGHAGHNGLKSTSQMLGTDDYHRVRLGIGHPGDKTRVTGYVLGNFSAEDQDWLALMLKAIADHAPHLVQGKPNDFASKVTQDMKAIKDKENGI